MCLPWPLSIVFFYCPEIVVKICCIRPSIIPVKSSQFNTVYVYVIRPIISQPSLPPARPFFTQIYLRSESFCWIVKVKTESNEIRLYINVSLSPPKAATKAEIISFYWSNIVEIIGISAGSAKFAIKWNLLLIPNGPMLIACVTLTCDGVLKQWEFPLVNGNKEDWTVSTSQALHITFGRLFPDFRLVFDFPL